MKNKKIVVLYGGLSSEREVSLRSGQAAYEGLLEAGFKDVQLLDVDRNVAAKLAEIKPDVCLNALHGTYGEDGRMQGLMDILDIPYTGSDCYGSMVAFDKILSKVQYEAFGVPTAGYKVVGRKESKAPFMPCVVKPAREGSTIGISIVKEEKDYAEAVEEALKYDDKVLVEEFVSGKELTVGILDGECLPIIWIRPKSGFYDYESKYTTGATEYIFETELTDEEIENVNSAAVKAFECSGCKSYGRVDVIITEDGKPYVLEVNTLPGMTATSLMPKAAREAGISFPELLTKMIVSALKEGK